MIDAVLNDPGFKAFVRKRGVAGKEVSSEEFQVLVDEFQGKQSADTAQATKVLASIPDPAPNAAAAENSFAPSSMAYNDLGVLTGGSRRDPIMSTVEEVTAQEQAQAAEQQQAAAQEDPKAVFTRDRVLPVINNLRQQREAIATGKFKNTYERKMANDALDGLVARNITDLEKIGYWGPEQSLTYTTIKKEEEAPSEEAFLRTVNAAMNPAAKQGVAVSAADANKALEVATQNYESTVRFADANPDDPKAKAAVVSAGRAVEAAREKAGLSSKPDMFADYSNISLNAAILRNAQRDNIPAIIIDNETVTEDMYDDALLGLQARLGTYEATPEFIEGRPQLKLGDFGSKEEWQTAVREAGGVYRDEKGQLVTPQRFANQGKKDSFKRFRTNDAPSVVNTPVADAPSLPRAEENMIRRMIEKDEDLTDTRFNPEVVESVRSKMDDEQVERALRKLYAGNSWASMVGLRNPNIKDRDMSGVLGRTNDPEAAEFLSKVDPDIVSRVYERTGRLQGQNAQSFKNSDGTWSKKVDPPEEVLFRIRQLASTRGK